MLVFVTDAVFCPQTLPAQAAMILKHLLQNASSTTMEYVLTPDRAKLKESIDDQINQIDRYTVCYVLCVKILIQSQVAKIDNNSSTKSCEYSRT